MSTPADAERLEGLARCYEHRVRFFVRKVARSYMMGSRWEDDLVSAGYFGLAKALDNLRPGASDREQSAYVSQRIIGAVIDEARVCITRNSTREVVTPLAGPDQSGSLGAVLVPPADPAESPEEVAELRSLRENVARVLELLDSDQRRLVRAYMEGDSIKEIALAEGIPIGTLRVRFRKSARLLRAKAPEMRRMLLEWDSG
ncbi:MAG: sigma-70 family RNA polymerase sigma factor [Proteobacteria bacterium]|nr:sigma-70 family RNA polymerase sigma factor [Pseudomonadota bacterium]